MFRGFSTPAVRRAVPLAAGLAAALALGACSSAKSEYADADSGETLTFVDDSHVQYLGHFDDREWLYEATRDSNGDILEMVMRHPQVGSLEFRRNDDGCLSGKIWGSAKGNYRRFCPA